MHKGNLLKIKFEDFEVEMEDQIVISPFENGKQFLIHTISEFSGTLCKEDAECTNDQEIIDMIKSVPQTLTKYKNETTEYSVLVDIAEITSIDISDYELFKQSSKEDRDKAILENNPFVEFKTLTYTFLDKLLPSVPVNLIFYSNFLAKRLDLVFDLLIKKYSHLKIVSLSTSYDIYEEITPSFQAFLKAFPFINKLDVLVGGKGVIDQTLSILGNF